MFLIFTFWTIISDSENIYFKLKAVKNGYITVTSKLLESEYGCNNITFCNSKKKPLIEENNCNKAVFAVKKDVTYYIKCHTNTGAYKIKYKFNAVTEKSGTSKSNEIKDGG